jgi:uncharacterized protein
MPTATDSRYAALLDHLRGLGPVAVALSGGTDSALVLAAAREALGGGVLALTAVTPYTPRWEAEEAQALAAALSVPHRRVELPLDEALRDNPPARCYLCKRRLFEALGAAAAREGFTRLVEGTNRDDLDDYRPGLRALAELGVGSPLLACGLGKAEVREVSRALGLASWDRPASACLLTRLPHGETVTAAVLRRIEAAEALLAGLGFRAVRVRAHGDLARIEVPAEAVGRLADRAPDVADGLRALGFRHVTLDLAGYRRGGLNQEGP